MFQDSDTKGRKFLELLDDDLTIIKSTYFKRGSWMKYFSHLNSLCIRVSRAIVNHAPIGEYHLRFFSREEFSCSCSHHLIEMRKHILHKYKRYNNY